MGHHLTWRGRHIVTTALALSATVLVMLSGVGCSSDRGTPVARWEPPAEDLLNSLEQPLVAGWRLKASDVEPLAEHSVSARFGFHDGPRSVDAFVGAIEDRAFFLAAEQGPGSASSWRLVGVDVRRGSQLFQAVPIATQPLPPRCYVNGDANVLCLAAAENVLGAADYTALVVDARSGHVDYSGPTDLRVGGATLAVRQLGTHAVAVTDRGGVFGIGPRADTTWSSPGVGLSGSTSGSVAFQEAATPAESNISVFSLENGEAIAPDVPRGATLRTALAYPGGFAAELERQGAHVGVGFFDDGGRRIGIVDDATLSSTSAGLPLPKVTGAARESVFDPLGRKMFDVPDHEGGVLLKGHTLFVNEETGTAFPQWRQYDLLTGKPGAICNFNMDNYLGTDGSLLIFAVTNEQAGLVARARDKQSCSTVWTLPAAVDSSAEVWRIGGSLIALSDDGGELRSLVPPF